MNTVRLAQLFDVDSFLPTKASVFLKRAGENGGSYFDLTSGNAVIDATNFSSITQDTNKVIIDDRTSDFTGSGYMRAQQVGSATEWASLNYSVRTDNPGKYYLYLRTNSGLFVVDILIDGQRYEERSISTGGTGWTWNRFEFVLPDEDQHVLSIKMKGDGQILDKVYIDTVLTSPTGSGHQYSISPFVTVHLQVYETNNDAPDTPLFVYAWKTTVDEVTNDDWYNFEIRPLDGSSMQLDGRYALVMAATGSDRSNFVIWELVDNDEYLMLPSALKVNNA